jgi:predicted ATP-binding protein involved in virulence
VKLKKVVLDNFRCFEYLEIDFGERLTVIVGGNGAGKTAVLDSIALLFRRFLIRLPNSKVGHNRSGLSDLRITAPGKLAPALYFYGIADIGTELGVLGAKLPGGNSQTLLKWSGSRLRDGSRTTRQQAKTIKHEGVYKGVNQIKWFADQLTDAENEGRAYQMPLMAYYGTNRTGRAGLDISLRRVDFKAEFARFDSLSEALKPTANCDRILEWFHARENEEAREIKKRRSFGYSDPILDVVRRAITVFFRPQFQNPRTELGPLRFMVDWNLGNHSIPLDLNQLSDGYRTTLALVADLARRMVEANPPGTIDDPLNTEAIVLIDEVDLHLHPAWQQRILAQLQETFPKSQFIVTTHSPQVLSTVPSESIRIVHDGKVFGATPGTEGAESARLLKQIFGVESRPLDNEFTRKLFRYRDLVYADQWESEEALALRKELDTHFRQNEPLLLELDLHIENRQWELAE